MLRSYDTKVLRRTGLPTINARLILATIIWGSAGPHFAKANNTVTDWNNEFLLITQQTSGNLLVGPPDIAREIAQVGEAMSDAVNAATNSTIPSFAYTGEPASNADANIAAATAAYTALSEIFTDPAWQTPISTVTGNGTNSSNTVMANVIIIPELRSFLSGQLTSLGLTSPGACATSTSSLCNGYKLGIAAATAVDNAPSTNPVTSGAVAAIQFGLTPRVPAGAGTTPGVYQPPNLFGSRPEMFPTWGSTTPTGLTPAQVASAQALVNGPPAINSQAYANALLQTECQGSSTGLATLPASIQSACAAAGFAQETVAQANAALFWNDPATSIQPPGHWLQIADTVIKSQNTSLLQSAQLTALLGESMNDAGIAAWATKYTDNLWRPITAIRNCGPRGTAAGAVTWSPNFTTCDTLWASLISTPPHPDYVAGHPAFSGSAATVLADFFGTDNINFSSRSDYYCNGGVGITTNFNTASQPISCTVRGVTYYICSATTTPIFANTDLPIGCTDGTQIYPLTNTNCNTVTTTGVNNGSPLICPITETFTSFSEASDGLNGAEFSRVVGGIHTPFSVEDALTIGNGIGMQIAAANGLPDVLPEPSSLSICSMLLLPALVSRKRTATRLTALSKPLLKNR